MHTCMTKDNYTNTIISLQSKCTYNKVCLPLYSYINITINNLFVYIHTLKHELTQTCMQCFMIIQSYTSMQHDLGYCKERKVCAQTHIEIQKSITCICMSSHLFVRVYLDLRLCVYSLEVYVQTYTPLHAIANADTYLRVGIYKKKREIYIHTRMDNLTVVYIYVYILSHSCIHASSYKSPYNQEYMCVLACIGVY